MKCKVFNIERDGTNSYYYVLKPQIFIQSISDTNLVRAMAQAVSRRPLTAEVRIRLCGICGGQSGTGTVFFPSTSVSFKMFCSNSTPNKKSWVQARLQAVHVDLS
jgi:hypothetical protein